MQDVITRIEKTLDERTAAIENAQENIAQLLRALETLSPSLGGGNGTPRPTPSTLAQNVAERTIIEIIDHNAATNPKPHHMDKDLMTTALKMGAQKCHTLVQ